MTKNERVSEAFSYLKEHRKVQNQSDFAKLLGKERSYISELLNGKRDVSEHFVGLMCDLFTDINSKWIIDGVGEMLKNNTSVSGNIRNNKGNISHVVGNGNKVDTGNKLVEDKDIKRLLDIIEQQSNQFNERLLASQAHIDKLLDLLSKK